MPKKQKGGSSDIDLSGFKHTGPNLSESQDAFISRMNGGAYYLNVGSQPIGGLAEVVKVEDPEPPQVSHIPSNNYPKPLYLQNGMGQLFSHIVNPITNRKVKVNSILGKKIVSEYSNVAFGQNNNVL